MRILFYLILAFLVIPSCTQKKEDIELLYSDSLLSDYGLDVEMNFYFGGDLEFQLITQEIQRIQYPVVKNIFPKGIQVFVFDQSFDTIAKINSDFAVDKKEEKLVELSKNVILLNAKNEQLITEKLLWDRQEKRIYTDDFVTITTDNEIIMGYGFSTNQTFSTYSLSNITGTIYL
tara:strand:- start:3428 stop:3952 length:525 start_codon:yes stop_codon:yes gene_type:complete